MFGGPNFLLTGAPSRATIALTISSSTANYNIYANRGGTYVAGKSDVTLTINSGVNVYSTSVGTPGLTVGSFATGDTVKIINNGTIAGKGGDGNEAGGTALSTAFATSITNNGTVQGGGGGGATTGGSYQCYCGQEHSFGAGGGGGGAGINAGAGAPGGGGACGDGSPGSPGGPIFGGAGGGNAFGYVDPASPGGNRGVGTTYYGAGSCTVGNAYITWTVTGNRYGPLN